MRRENITAWALIILPFAALGALVVWLARPAFSWVEILEWIGGLFAAVVVLCIITAPFGCVPVVVVRDIPKEEE